MPQLRVQSMELPRETKRMLATELTQTVVEARHLRGLERDLTPVRFVRCAADDVAIGGKLVANGRAPDVEVEYRDHDLTGADKRKLARRITDTVGRVLGLGGDQLMRISVLFVEYETRDFAVGGTLLRHRWRGGVGRALRRVTTAIRRRRMRAPADRPALPSN